MGEDKQKDSIKNESEVTVWSFLAGIVILALLVFIIFKVFGFLWGIVIPDADTTQNQTVTEQVQNETTDTANTAQNEVVVEKKQEDIKEYSDYEAYYDAQKILEKFLKSPSTAKYPNSSKAVIKRYAEGGFRVESYVDSQNGFGAIVRSNWIVVFQSVGDSVKILAVSVDGETLYKAENLE